MHKSCALLLAVLAAGAYAQTPAGAIPAANPIDQGLAAMRSHQPQQALLAFQQAIAANPQDATANLLAASAELALYDGKAAVPYAERAEQLDPASWKVHTALVTAYTMAGDVSHRDNERNLLRKYHADASIKDAHNSSGFLLDLFRVNAFRVEAVEYFEPVGKYNTYYRFLVRDEAGHHVWTIQLDSDSLNQASWAQAYPKQAAQGQRQFQIESPPGDGSVSYGTFSGNASYDYVRSKVIQTLTAQTTPFPAPSAAQ